MTLARLSQETVEVAVSPTDEKARISQEIAEVAVSPTDEKARISQEIVEAVVKPTDEKARLSQLAVEVVVGVRPSLDLSFDYITRNAVGASLGLNYNLNSPGEPAPPVWDAQVYGEPVYTDALIDPEVYGEGLLSLEAIDADLAIDYGVIQLATKDLGLDYVIDEVTPTQAGADLGFEYIIGAPGGAHADLAFTYQITKASKVFQRGQDLKLKWRIIQPTFVGSSLSFDYPIQQKTQVGKDLGFSFTVGINNLAGTNESFTYGIDPSPTAVGQDLFFGFQISINNLVGIDLGFTYDLQQKSEVGSDLFFDYDTQQKSEVGQDLDIDFEDEIPRPRAVLDIDYVVDQPTPSANLVIDYEIEAVTAPARRRGHGGPIYVTRPQLQPEPTQAGSELHFSYGILGVVDSELGIDAGIRTITRAQFRMDAPVLAKRGVGLSIDHRIVDFYDTNEDILRSEIDPDLTQVA